MIYFNLVGKGYLPLELIEQVENLIHMQSVFMVHIGIDFDPVKYQRKLWKEKSSEYLEEMKKAGLQMNQVDKGPFIEKVKPIYQELENTSVGEIAKRIQALAGAN